MKENGGRVVRLEVDKGRALAKGSSGECLSAVPLSLQPSFAGARRLFTQRRDSARGTMEPTAEILDAVDPVVANHAKTVQNGCHILRNSTTLVGTD